MDGISGGTAEEFVTKRAQALIEVQQAGASGEGIEYLLANVSIDIALIMAGTNDLGRGSSAAATLASLQQLHAACHEKGVRTVALAIPSGSSVAGWQLNDGLYQWCNTNDMCVLFFNTTFLNPSDPLFHDDGLHFKPAGYVELGHRLAPAVQPFLPGSVLRPLATTTHAPEGSLAWYFNEAWSEEQAFEQAHHI